MLTEINFLFARSIGLPSKKVLVKCDPKSREIEKFGKGTQGKRTQQHANTCCGSQVNPNCTLLPFPPFSNLLVSFVFFSSESISKLNFYKKIPKADFPNLYDYHCDGSRLFGACELAVYDITEAKYMCDLDDRCQAFVTTGKILWSGKQN